MTGMVLGLVAVIAAIGAGRWFVLPSQREDEHAWVHALMSGLLLWGLIGLCLGLCGWLTPWAFTGIAVLSLLGWLPAGRPSIGPLGWVGIMIGMVLLSPGIIDVLGPIMGTDERYLHVGLSGQMLLHEGLVGGLLHPNGSRPLTLQMIYTGLLSSGETTALAGFHWWLAVALMGFMVQLGHRHFGHWGVGVLAAAMLAGSTSIQEATGQAASDLPTALAVLCALDAAVTGRVRAGAIAAATALSIKYTAAAPLLGILLLAKVPPKARVRTVGFTVLLLCPWWLRNAMDGLHPLFPFAGWPAPDMQFQFLEKWGAGRDLLDFIWLPYRAIFEASPTDYRFHGRVHPFILMCWLPLPLVFGSSRFRPWLLASLIGFGGWAMGPHWLRYLIPSLPIIALTGAAMTVPLMGTRLRAGILALIFMASTHSGLQGFGATLQDNFTALREDSRPSGQQAVEFCNDHLPKDATVALLFAWSSANLHRKQLIGSVEDHVPTRHFLLRNRADPVGALVAAGATHALVRNTKFQRTNYTFIARTEFDSRFEDPVHSLDHMLLMEAQLLYRGPHHRVYKLAAH
jgi:hypothetical protein